MKTSIILLLLGSINQHATAIKLKQIDGQELIQLDSQIVISRGDEQWEEAVQKDFKDEEKYWQNLAESKKKKKEKV